MSAWIPVSALLILALVAYSHTVKNQFVALDDPLLITENPIVRTFSLEHVVDAFTTFDPELYIPLPLVSYQIEYLFFGANPLVVHLDNLLLHLLCIVLVYVLIQRLFQKHFMTLIVTALFALHPINVETVAWAAGRKDLLTALFALATCVTYQERHWRPKLCHSLAPFLFLLGLLSKVTIVGLPFILFAIDLLHGESIHSKKMWQRLLPFFGLSLIFLVIALYGKSDAWGLQQLSFFAHLHSVLVGAFFPLSKLLFWPPAFTTLYPLADTSTTLVLILGVITSSLIVFTYKQSPALRPQLLLSLAFYFIFLAPSLVNLVKASAVYAGSDRYAYLPGIGIFLLFAFLMESFLKSSISRRMVLPLLVVFLMPLTFLQVGIWSSSRTLFAHAIAVSPHSAAAHLGMGNVCFDEQLWQCALGEYRQAHSLVPSAKTATAIGNVFLHMEDMSKAEAAYREALRIDSTYGDAYLGLSMIALQEGNIQNEITFLTQALQWTSDRVSFENRVIMHANLATAYGVTGDHDQEIAENRAALTLDPTFAPAHYNLSLALEELGEHEEAQKELQTAYSLDPSLRSVR